MRTEIIFSIAFKDDTLFGIIPLPYLLKKNKQENYYQTFKQLTKTDLDHQIIPYQDWIDDIIQKNEQLKAESLNDRFNKKLKKYNFHQFYNKQDKKSQKHILQEIDKIRLEIFKHIKKNQPLIFFKESGPANIYPEEMLKVNNEATSLKFFFEAKTETFHYQLKLFYQKKEIHLTHSSTKIIINQPAFFIYKQRLHWLDNNDFNALKIKPFLNKEEIIIPKKLQGDFFKLFIKPVVRKFNYEIKGFEMKQIETSIKAILRIERSFNDLFLLVPIFVYNQLEVPFYSEQQIFVDVKEINNEYSLSYIQRNTSYESLMLENLKNMSFQLMGKYFILPHKVNNKFDFTEQISLYISRLESFGFIIQNRLFSQEISFETPIIKYNITEKQDWFDLNIIIQIGEFEIPFKKLKNHILQKKQEYLLPNDTLFLIPLSWFSELHAAALRTQNNNKSLFHKTHAALLKENKLIAPAKNIHSRFFQAETLKKIDIPKGITAQLRSYQKTGFRWLYHLTENDFGVCLADDMGLGKTLQVITLLQHYFQNKKAVIEENLKPESQLSIIDNLHVEDHKNAAPFQSVLLVVPRSLIYNWVEELKKFAASLSFFIYYGNKRQEEIKNEINKKQIIITTYGVVRKDVNELKKTTFSYLILDESQSIKNPHSMNYQAMVQLNANHRVSITGTPFENKLQDLWAQMNFLNPGMLGNLNYFEKTYVKPIGHNVEALEAIELQKIIKPLLLRRLKQDVAKELPEKTEQIIYCDMSDEQKDLYEQEKSSVRNQLLFEKNKKNYVQKLAVLNRLRQLALHPAMLDPETNISSGKFESIIQNMENLLEQKSKFLVFSSFVKHLNLIKEHFEEQGIKYAMLTGKDSKRQQIVENYQNDVSLLPFLISIKAGGVGLNITKATYVLLIDPWWNPFVEQQAIDRTHRIGQTQKVNIYKFISKDTLEEKILQLQQNKMQMSESLIGGSLDEKIKIEDFEKLL